ncbi:MAG: mandelate racemase/muconate lactonizing enzyme family protein, partial [Bryobacteraceae bacterium]|nr:mandelate racemase/muconate lactonizing enzyme family protein [Bryobacteraceae bacterium]
FATFDAIREATAPEAQIAADALWRLDPGSALPFSAELDRRNAFWLEAPLLPEDVAAHAKLARAIRTPLALGESYRTRWEMEPFFREQAMRYAQPDLGRTGISEGRQIARLAASWDVAVVPHLSIALGPQIAAAIHFAASTENCPMLEFNPSVLEVANRYLSHPVELTGAAYVVPGGPGLGIDLLEGELRQDLDRAARASVGERVYRRATG